jgi:metallo-beta-lactamase class B
MILELSTCYRANLRSSRVDSQLAFRLLRVRTDRHEQQNGDTRNNVGMQMHDQAVKSGRSVEIIQVKTDMTKHTSIILGVALSMIVALIVTAREATPPVQQDWTEPFPAFRIAGNLYYVGSKGLASYLITTPDGHILINSNLEANVPMIRTSVESLGFKFSDIKILLISHAHFDHCAGSASIKQLTGAKYMVMDGDVEVVESGGKSDFQYGNDPTAIYPPAKVDRVLHDGDVVQLGDATLKAHLTPGHTKGCTTWTMKVHDGTKLRDVVIIGSPNVNPGYNLVNSTAYPRMRDDFMKTFRALIQFSIGLGERYSALPPGRYSLTITFCITDVPEKLVSNTIQLEVN